MPRRKPAHTTSAASDHLRRAIASQAARLMAEDGIGDYGQAKRKAARHLGAGEGDALPSNEEVAAELRAYQSLYQDEEQVERLRELRRAALDVMELLADFRPYLTGAVLDGTAGRYAEVEIELFADSAKDVEIFLLSHNIPYEIADSGQQHPDAPEARLRIDWQDTTVLLAVFPYQVERRQRRSPHSGKSHDRAKTADVAALLAS
jgi:hypothetical protein